MSYLLDANLLIAIVLKEHEHFESGNGWLEQVQHFLVSPVTEGALVRYLLRAGESGRTAREVVDRIRAHPRCGFVPDDISYADVELSTLRGHRQVTDAYLVALAEAHDATLATLDQMLVAAYPDRVLLVGAQGR